MIPHVRGHDAIRDRFRKALEQGRMGHAYLFVGPDGVGKRTFAQELGKALLCLHPQDHVFPCGTCTECKIVQASTHPDLFVIRKPEDKLELPIDTIRDFTHQLGLKPVRGQRRIAILEDADYFNEESANAFLKSLEEPPPGSVMFLLATSTETQLATILSRCQAVHFRPVSEEIVRAILEDHDVTEPGMLDRLVQLAHGSPGRALLFRDEAFWKFREAFCEHLRQQKPDPVALAVLWSAFVESAGKDSALQRERAAQALGMLLDLVQAALYHMAGAQVHSAIPGDRTVEALGQRLGIEGLAHIAEACTRAEYYNDRRVQLALITEWLMDQLCTLRPQAMFLGG